MQWLSSPTASLSTIYLSLYCNSYIWSLQWLSSPTASLSTIYLLSLYCNSYIWSMQWLSSPTVSLSTIYLSSLYCNRYIWSMQWFSPKSFKSCLRFVMLFFIIWPELLTPRRWQYGITAQYLSHSGFVLRESDNENTVGLSDAVLSPLGEGHVTLVQHHPVDVLLLTQPAEQPELIHSEIDNNQISFILKETTRSHSLWNSEHLDLILNIIDKKQISFTLKTTTGSHSHWNTTQPDLIHSEKDNIWHMDHVHWKNPNWISFTLK